MSGKDRERPSALRCSMASEQRVNSFVPGRVPGVLHLRARLKQFFTGTTSIATSYSARSVRSGSRVAARHAGRAPAAAPIPSSSTPALTYVTGSLLLTP